VFGTRGTLVLKTEKEALLFNEEGPPGEKKEQRLWVIESAKEGGPVLDSYETTAPAAAAALASSGTEKISRGYREEMEHFCYCIREGRDELLCNGRVAMGDAIMALTANLAMKHQKRIEFKDEWFDPDTDAVPETDEQVS
jgi:predicted dehydrogenase